MCVSHLFCFLYLIWVTNAVCGTMIYAVTARLFTLELRVSNSRYKASTGG